MFIRCDWELVAGFGGLFYNGLKAGEVMRVMDLLAVPAERRLECYDKVRFCVRTAQPVLNEKMSP